MVSFSALPSLVTAEMTNEKKTNKKMSANWRNCTAENAYGGAKQDTFKRLTLSIATI